MLEVSRIACVRGNRRLFDDVSFRLGARQALRVAGENGSGKTSLLRIVAGLSPAEGGTVSWKGVVHGSGGAAAEDYRGDLLFLGHANGFKDDLTPVENLRFAAVLDGSGAGDAALHEALEAHDLAAAAHLPVRLLSQGQKRRAALCRLALSRHKPLWILDEPFAALDAGSVARCAAELAAHVARGGLLVFTTHQDAALDGVQVRSLHLGAG